MEALLRHGTGSSGGTAPARYRVGWCGYGGPVAERVRTVKRVDRAFAFIDLSGVTAFTDTRGDAEAVAVLARFRARLHHSEMCADKTLDMDENGRITVQ